ncbi:MAG: hypothetical protein ACLVMF_11150 [Christensenellales bacterium]
MNQCKQSKGVVTLKGQRSCYLPVQKGLNTISIRVISGKLRLNHCSYTSDGGTWLSFPSGGRTAHYNMGQGQQYHIVVDIQDSFGKLDKIDVVNIRLFTQLTFEYEINIENTQLLGG